MLDNKKETMTLEDFKIVSSQAKRMGAIHFALQGGEPLLLVDLEKIIAQIGPSDAFISITTNGALMTKELFLRLKKLGLDMLTVSIDSGIPQEHDKFRGVNGSFRKAVNAINIAREYNVSVTVNTTITHENISSGGFEEIVKLCDKLKVKLNILFPAICGRYAGRPDMMLSQDEKDKVQNIINKHVFVRRDLDANYLTYGCGAVKEMIYISAYGDVMPCSFIHASLGNIKTDLLSSCVEKGLQFSYFSGYCPVCPPMEDADFINKYMRRISGSKTLPAAFEEIFY
jgi:MoaA/NifB/PqqE/SkfB family radical SAM enzyme